MHIQHTSNNCLPLYPAMHSSIKYQQQSLGLPLGHHNDCACPPTITSTRNLPCPYWPCSFRLTLCPSPQNRQSAPIMTSNESTAYISTAYSSKAGITGSKRGRRCTPGGVWWRDLLQGAFAAAHVVVNDLQEAGGIGFCQGSRAW